MKEIIVLPAKNNSQNKLYKDYYTIHFTSELNASNVN